MIVLFNITIQTYEYHIPVLECMKKNFNKCTENHYSNINEQTDAAIAVLKEKAKKNAGL